MSFTKDSKTMRSIVNFLWILDTLHLAFVVYTMYFALITSRNRPPGSSTVWTNGALVIASNLSDFCVRCIFIHRICHLSGHAKLVASVLGTPSLASAGEIRYM
ncbi:hypothetical protein BC835DRAFT_1413322 [Cytidiella melzeri]|nr:hypothetical protein BC835DRAFT_1413322 [Cytidiella melzeri]